jgi:diguanylate cyclase (GGDEF)-like protein
MRLAERSLLLVEDDPLSQKQLCMLLEGEVSTLYAAESGEEGLALFRRYGPDLILSDIRMPGIGGLEMARRIRAETPEQAILFLSAHDDRETLLAAIDVAADAYILKPILDVTQLVERLERVAAMLHERERRREAIEHLVHDAHHDPLTEIPNRRFFLNRLEALLEDRKPLALLFIDLDDFKSVNDRYGHTSGDHTLLSIAQRLRSLLPEGGILARIGGDEFALLLPDTGEEADLKHCIHRILGACRQKILLPCGQEIIVSCSVGVSRYPRDSQRLDELIDLADRAMYRSKRSGKDAATLHEEPGRGEE